MDAPIKHGRGRPPDNALLVSSVADARDDADLEFDGMMDIFRGFEKLRTVRTRRQLRRQRWILADSLPVQPQFRPAA